MGHQRTKRRTVRNGSRNQHSDALPTAIPEVISAASTVSTKQLSDTFAIDYAPLRRDLLRVAAVLVVVIGVLVSLTITNQKTGWLDRAAGQLVHWLKLDQ